MLQQQPKLRNYLQEQHRFGGGGESETTQPAAQPVAPAAPNPTVQTGDAALAAANAASRAARATAAQQSNQTLLTPATAPDSTTKKSTLLGS